MNTVLIVNCAWVTALLGGMIWTIFLRERTRTRKLKGLAPTFGFCMVNGNGKAALNEFCFGTPLFFCGDCGSNRISNAMKGSAAGLRCVLFDLRYEVDNGGTVENAGKTTYRRTVAAYAAPHIDLPTFSIKKNGFFSRRAADKVPIEGDPDFSDRFVVTGADRAAVQRVFRPALTRSLVAAHLPEKLIIEGAGSSLVFYHSNKRLRPEHWKQFLDETSTIAGEFLSHQASKAAALSA